MKMRINEARHGGEACGVYLADTFISNADSRNDAVAVDGYVRRLE